MLYRQHYFYVFDFQSLTDSGCNIINQRMKRIYLEAPNKYLEDQYVKFPEKLNTYVSRSRFRSFAMRQRYLSSKFSNKSDSKDALPHFYDIDSIPMLRSIQGDLKKSNSISETSGEKYKLNFKLSKDINQYIQSQKKSELVHNHFKQHKMQSEVESKQRKKKTKERRYLINKQVKTEPTILQQCLQTQPDRSCSLNASAILSEERPLKTEMQQIFANPWQISKKTVAVSKKYRMIKQRKGRAYEIAYKNMEPPFFS